MKTIPVSKNQVKNWRKLKSRKHRYQSGQFIAEGERCVEQIFHNKRVKISALLLSDVYSSAPFILKGGQQKPPVYSLDRDQVSEISDTENPQGVLAVCSIPEEISPESLKSKTGFLIATDSIQDPGNLGTIIRTAVWFGAGGLICGTGTVDPWNPKVVRSTAGATGMLPMLQGNLDDLLAGMEGDGWQVLLLDGGEGAVALQTESALTKSILVIGNEANGIDESLFRSNRKKIKITGDEGTVESLNAAIAAGIAMYWLGREKFDPDY